MKSVETKSINLEIKDFDKGKREAVIAHAAYNNIDRTKDISRKGMFNKSWTDNKSDIAFYVNHNSNLTPGKPIDFWDTEEKAFTKVYLGTHTLGEDTLRMMDEGIITKASFGYIPTKKNFIEVKGQKVRELKEVQHIETSVLTILQANPLANVESVTKSFTDLMVELKTLSQSETSSLRSIMGSDFNTLTELMQVALNADEKSDLYTWAIYQISRRSDFIADIRGQLRYNASDVKQLKSDIDTMEKFCRNTNASDGCIISIERDLEQAKSILSKYDTAYTRAGDSLEPDASRKISETVQYFINGLKN